MSAPAVAPTQNLIDGVDVDAVAQAARGCPGVEDLHGGFPGEVATYLPGRRILGVRVDSRVVEVQVRTAWGMPVLQIAVGIQAAVAPLAGGRAVDVTIADLGDPPRTDQTTAARHPGASRQSGATAHDTAEELAEAAGQMTFAGEAGAGGQAAAKHTGPTPAGEAQGDPPLTHAARPTGSERGPTEPTDRPEQVDPQGPPGSARDGGHPTRKGSDRS